MSADKDGIPGEIYKELIRQGEEIQELARLLASGPATWHLNTYLIASRLYGRGVRVVKR